MLKYYIFLILDKFHRFVFKKNYFLLSNQNIWFILSSILFAKTRCPWASQTRTLKHRIQIPRINRKPRTPVITMMRCSNSSALKLLLGFCAIIFTALSLLVFNLNSVSQTPQLTSPISTQFNSNESLSSQHPQLQHKKHEPVSPTCATIEEMGNADGAAASLDDVSSLRVRTLIQDHFALHGICLITNLLYDMYLYVSIH